MFSLWLSHMLGAFSRRLAHPSPLTLPRASAGSAQPSYTPAVRSRVVPQRKASTALPPARPRLPTRIIEWESSPTGSTKTLGRVVMVGKFSEICAELDRLAALEMA